MSAQRAGGTPIACGPMTAVLDGADLVDVRWGGAQIAERIYVAVRDEDWNSVPARISSLRTIEDGTSARVEFDAQHEADGLRFDWVGTVVLTRDGTIAFEMRGRAASDFEYCKIGFNVHHSGRVHAGRRFRCRTRAGEHVGVFAADLQPQLVRDGTLTAMTPPFDRLDLDLDDVAVTMEFAGDMFEMQDQRNWIDANWKSYGTPLAEGFPKAIRAGQEIVQRVTVTAIGSPTPARGATVDVEIGEADPGVLPRLGHVLTHAPTSEQLAALRPLRPAHLRIDLHDGDDLNALVAEADAVARSLGAALEVAVHLRPNHARRDADQFANALRTATVRLDRVAVLAESEGFSALRGSCPPALAIAVRDAVASAGVHVGAILAGTPQYFADINRDRPDYSGIDGVVFAANPQVHVCDDRGVMQNAEALADVVSFAHRIYPAGAIVLSPVELLGRFGPFPAGPVRSDGRPANEDPRMATSFCAAWTVAALAALSRSRADSVTMFDLTGPRGLMGDAVNPVARVFGWLAARSERSLLPIRSSDSDRLAILSLGGGELQTLIMANLTPNPVAVRIARRDAVELDAYQVVVVTDGTLASLT